MSSFTDVADNLKPFYIENIKNKGFGLKANCSLSKGQLITQEPARKIPKNTNMDFSMAQFLFVEPNIYEKESIRSLIMVCGPITFLNHSSRPNCIVSWLVKPSGLLIALLHALSSIHPGDELTIKYTDESDYKTDGLLG